MMLGQSGNGIEMLTTVLRFHGGHVDQCRACSLCGEEGRTAVLEGGQPSNDCIPLVGKHLRTGPRIGSSTN